MQGVGAGCLWPTKSHTDKMPGLAVRDATVLALLEAAATEGEILSSITSAHLGRACHYVCEHLRGHAYRAYGAASRPPEVKAASIDSEFEFAQVALNLLGQIFNCRRRVFLFKAERIEVSLFISREIALVFLPSIQRHPLILFLVRDFSSVGDEIG